MKGGVCLELLSPRVGPTALNWNVISPEPYVKPDICLPTRWRRHRLAMLIVVAVTLGALLATLWAAGSLDRRAVLAVARAQLLLMVAVVPIAAWSARTRLDVLFRAGPTTDTFAVVVLVVAVLSHDVTIRQALGAYILVAAVALVGMGLLASCRAVGLGRFPAACSAFVLLAVGGAGAFASLPAKVNIDLALQDLLQIRRSAPGWLTTFLIASVAAGMAWTAGYLAESRRQSPCDSC